MLLQEKIRFWSFLYGSTYDFAFALPLMLSLSISLHLSFVLKKAEENIHSAAHQRTHTCTHRLKYILSADNVDVLIYLSFLFQFFFVRAQIRFNGVCVCLFKLLPSVLYWLQAQISKCFGMFRLCSSSKSKIPPHYHPMPHLRPPSCTSSLINFVVTLPIIRMWCG